MVAALIQTSVTAAALGHARLRPNSFLRCLARCSRSDADCAVGRLTLETPVDLTKGNEDNEDRKGSPVHETTGALTRRVICRRASNPPNRLPLRFLRWLL